MASLLQIRNVPDEARQVLRARAAVEGESLNSYLLALIGREVARPTVREVLERAARRPGRSDISAVETIQRLRLERENELLDRSTT